MVADVLGYYARERAPAHANPRHTSARLASLPQWFSNYAGRAGFAGAPIRADDAAGGEAAVFSVVTADGAIVQEHTVKGLAGLAPAGTVQNARLNQSTIDSTKIITERLANFNKAPDADSIREPTVENTYNQKDRES
jgi:hypothetical protein